MNPEALIYIFAILWAVSAINAVRKSMARAREALGSPDAANANTAAQNEIAARNDATQRAARVLRMRMQQAVVAAAPPVAVQKPQTPAYLAPPADQAMTSLINMEAPSMPTFDAPGLDAGSAAYSFGTIGTASASSSAATSFAGRGFLLTEAANGPGAAAIVASAVIGPPVGLRSGPLSASDW